MQTHHSPVAGAAPDRAVPGRQAHTRRLRMNIVISFIDSLRNFSRAILRSLEDYQG